MTSFNPILSTSFLYLAVGKQEQGVGGFKIRREVFTNLRDNF